MGKSKLTKEIEKALLKENNKIGTFSCIEVKMGIGKDQNYFNGKNERVDFITYSTDTTFKCYEIKVSETDLNSSASMSFYGDYNYLVLPIELYNKVKDKTSFKRKYSINKGIGIKTYNKGLFKVEQKAKKKSISLGVKTLLLESMLRSLERDARKYWKMSL